MKILDLLKYKRTLKSKACLCWKWKPSVTFISDSYVRVWGYECIGNCVYDIFETKNSYLCSYPRRKDEDK